MIKEEPKNGWSDQSGNKYMFHCPTVGRDVLFVMCAFKKAKHWRGEPFAEQDCKTAMRGGKCPCVAMQTVEYNEGERMFYSAELKLHKIPAAISDRLSRVRVSRHHANGAELTPEQIERLFGEENMKDPVITVGFEKPKRKKKKEMTDMLDDVNTDMGDMLTKSLEEV